jgi:hypothetical protein
MNENIKNLITYENIKSYSDACISLNEILITKMDEYNLLIIPSRGAYPFYRLAKTSSYSLGSKIDAAKINNHYQVWLLPYTADWGNAKIQADGKKIRAFWSKVLFDTIQKKTSPYTSFYENIVQSLQDKITFNPSKCNLSIKNKTDKFIFIDTAISGRAICNILEAFDDLNIKNYFIILIAQNNGDDLKREYREIIESKISLGNLELIKVSEIFSEDASPLLNGGISSMVFPSLIERACDEIQEFQNNQYCGAGLWFIDSVSNLYGTDLNGIRGIIHSLLNYGIRANFNETNSDKILKQNTEFLAGQIISNAANFNLFDPENTKLLIKNRIKSKNINFKDDIYVTGSHVVRMDLDNKIVKEIIKNTYK